MQTKKRWKVVQTIERHYYVLATSKEDAERQLTSWGPRPLPHETIVKSTQAKESF